MRRPVRGTVIDYQNLRDEGSNRGDDLANMGCLVKTRNQCNAVILPIHR